MRKNRILLLFFLLLLSCNAFSGGFLRSDNKRIVNDDGAFLLRGIGLGGWVLQEPYMLQLSGIAKTQTDIRSKIHDVVGEEQTDLFYDAWIRNGVTKKDIDSLAAWGFNSIRFPMHYDIFTLPIEQEPVKGENTWLEKGFAITDSLLSWCAANRIYLMLDLHAAPGGQGNDIAISDASAVRLWQNEENKKKTIALWQKIAERYVDEPWIGAYDIINEPNYGFEDKDDTNGCAEMLNAPLRQLMIDITKAIRTIDKNHLIVISGNCWGNNYNGIFPLWDDQTVISFHKYWNYNSDRSIADFLEYREKYNAPLWLSESGENSNVWHNDAIRLLEKNEIGWCWWTYKKMGLNCPMQIKSVDGYDDLRTYWKEGGNKPNRETAWRVLKQLTENYKIENTVFRKDYLDALFRQVKTDRVIPWKDHFLKKSGSLTVYASDYDMGRSGYAYHDSDSANYRTDTKVSIAGNKGGAYRNDGVDIITCSDDSNGYCISYTESGEWMQYTIRVEEEGLYFIQASVSAKNNESGALRYVVNNISSETIGVNKTDDPKKLIPVAITLNKGENVIRIYIENGGFDLSKFVIYPK